MAPFVGLSLDDANGPPINENDVVSRTNVRRVFAHGNPLPGAEINGILILNMPTSFGQPGVDLVASDLLGFWFFPPEAWSAVHPA